jgi:hypothetical protein
LNAEILYDELARQGGAELSVEEAKATLVTFNSFLASDHSRFDPAPVLAKWVFPVRFPSGKVKLQRGTDEFALMDRQPLDEAFAALAKFLDFDTDEIRILQPLIRWAGLGERYLSKLVRDISHADMASVRPISSPHRDLKKRAHSLLRYVGGVIGLRLRRRRTNDECDLGLR